MGRIYLVRHGETYWNLQKKLQGQRDSKLTPQGEDHARRIAKYLKKLEKIDLIYSSSLNRAIQTAKVIVHHLNLNEPILARKRLSEMSFGILEGKLESEVASEIEEYLRDKANYQFPEGEDYSLVLTRVRPIVRKVLAQSRKFNILIVGHQAVNRAIIGSLCNLPKEEFVNFDHPHKVIYIYETGRNELFYADVEVNSRKKLRFEGYT